MQHSEDGYLLLLLGNIYILGICSVCSFILTAAVIKLQLWFIMIIMTGCVDGSLFILSTETTENPWNPFLSWYCKHPELNVFLFSITRWCIYRAAVAAALNTGWIIFTLFPVQTWLESLIQLVQSLPAGCNSSSKLRHCSNDCVTYGF